MSHLKTLLLAIFKFLPIITLMFSLIVVRVALALMIKPTCYVTFGFLAFQVYVNWIAVRIAQNTKAEDARDAPRIWYCPKCHTNSSISCHHCTLCNRCVVQRDHHCFFLGACICLRNLSHFITFCLYTGMTCFHVDLHVHLYLYHHFHNQEGGSPSIWHLGSRYFFPVALGKWLSGQEEFPYLMLVALFDLLMSASIFTLGFGLYNLYISFTGEAALRLSGKHPSTSLWDNFHDVFGRWGVLNFVFPIVLLNHFHQKKSLLLQSKNV